MKNIHEKMWQISNLLEDIKNLPYEDKTRKTYDKVGFVYDLEYLVTQLGYFYDNVVPKKTGNPSTSPYVPKSVPKEHQVAFYNLTRGFSKELFGGHYCYVLKCMKYKHLVIPTTSVTIEDATLDPQFEVEIKIKNFINDNDTRLQISDIRCIDIQRLYVNKGFFDVETSREVIVEKVSNLIF